MILKISYRRKVKQQMGIPRTGARFVAHCTVQVCSSLILYVPCIMSSSIYLPNFSCTKFPSYMFQHSRGAECRQETVNRLSLLLVHEKFEYSTDLIVTDHNWTCLFAAESFFFFLFFFPWLHSPSRPGPPHCCGSESTLRLITLSRTPVDE